MKKIELKIANGGIALGKAFILSDDIKVEKISGEPENEIKRFESASNTVCKSFEALIKKAQDEGNNVLSGILDAQLSIAGDPVIKEKITEYIKSQSVNAEFAVLTVGESTANEFKAMDNDYIKARSEDVLIVSKKVIKTLLGKAEDIPSEPAVIFADEISPEQMVTVGEKNLLAMVTVNGSSLSHTAILAGTYDIPYVFGLPSDLKISSETEIAVDGDEGVIIIEPDKATKEIFAEKIRKADEEAKNITREDDLPVELFANITCVEDADRAIKNGAEGIGLFRTEFLFMNRRELPSEEEQFEAYKKVAEKMAGKEVIIRTMDIGSDKKTECLPLPNEENPALGRRAIRICLENTDLFRTQLRAILRVAKYGNIGIMYPMIASAWEIDAIKEQVALAAEELKNRGEKYAVPKQGIMIETPAAAVISDVLAEKVDFFSIGTNDLTQYALALDRQSEGLDEFYDPHHEAVYRLIEMVVTNAHKHNVKVGICGELGGNPKALERLIKCGVDELSMAPAKLKKARGVLKNIKLPVAAVENFTAPADGNLISMSDIPDEAFSSGALGECVAVDPVNGDIYAPCDGEISMVADTYHAFSIKTPSGKEVLIHIGIDTVALKGTGFKCNLTLGQKVRQGEKLMAVNIDKIKSAGYSPMVIMVYNS